MSRHDLIIDFETMGKRVQDCAVIDCSVMVFDWDRFLSDDPYTVRDLNKARRFKISVADQVKNYNWKIEKDTVEFWERQAPEVRANIKPKPDDLTVSQFVTEFHNYLINSPKIVYWWTRGNTFDPIILNRMVDSQGKLLHIEEYLKFWRVRDTRTHIDAKFDYEQKNGFVPVKDEEKWKKVFKEHDSSWDVLADVLRLQAICRAENDKEQVIL